VWVTCGITLRNPNKGGGGGREGGGGRGGFLQALTALALPAADLDVRCRNLSNGITKSDRRTLKSSHAA